MRQDCAYTRTRPPRIAKLTAGPNLEYSKAQWRAKARLDLMEAKRHIYQSDELHHGGHLNPRVLMKKMAKSQIQVKADNQCCAMKNL